MFFQAQIFSLLNFIDSLNALRLIQGQIIDFQQRFLFDITILLDEVYGNSEYEAYSEKVDSLPVNNMIKENSNSYGDSVASNTGGVQNTVLIINK